MYHRFIRHLGIFLPLSFLTCFPNFSASQPFVPPKKNKASKLKANVSSIDIHQRGTLLRTRITLDVGLPFTANLNARQQLVCFEIRLFHASLRLTPKGQIQIRHLIANPATSVQMNDKGQIKSVDTTSFQYDIAGRLSQIGKIKLKYSTTGWLQAVGPYTLKYRLDLALHSLGNIQFRYDNVGRIQRIGPYNVKYHPGGRIEQIAKYQLHYHTHRNFIESITGSSPQLLLRLYWIAPSLCDLPPLKP